MRSVLALAALLLMAAAPPEEVPVQLNVDSATPLSGRLIVFAEAAKPGDKATDRVDANPFAATATAVAARDIGSLSAGQIAVVDADTDSIPTAWSKLPPGRYRIQAVLDVNGDYNYAGRGAGDYVSDVTEVSLPGPLRLRCRPSPRSGRRRSGFAAGPPWRRSASRPSSSRATGASTSSSSSSTGMQTNFRTV